MTASCSDTHGEGSSSSNTGAQEPNVAATADVAADVAATQVDLEDLDARVSLLELTTVRRMKVKDMDVIEKLAARVRK